MLILTCARLQDITNGVYNVPMQKNKSAVYMGRLSAKNRKKKLGIKAYKEEMSERGKNGAKARWDKVKKLSTGVIANA